MNEYLSKAKSDLEAAEAKYNMANAPTAPRADAVWITGPTTYAYQSYTESSNDRKQAKNNQSSAASGTSTGSVTQDSSVTQSNSTTQGGGSPGITGRPITAAQKAAVNKMVLDKGDKLRKAAGLPTHSAEQNAVVASKVAATNQNVIRTEEAGTKALADQGVQASKTTYIDDKGNKKTGYIINGRTYQDAAGLTPVNIGSRVVAGDGREYIKTANGSMLYEDWLKRQGAAESGSAPAATGVGTAAAESIYTDDSRLKDGRYNGYSTVKRDYMPDANGVIAVTARSPKGEEGTAYIGPDGRAYIDPECTTRLNSGSYEMPDGRIYRASDWQGRDDLLWSPYKSDYAPKAEGYIEIPFEYGGRTFYLTGDRGIKEFHLQNDRRVGLANIDSAGNRYYSEGNSNNPEWFAMLDAAMAALEANGIELNGHDGFYAQGVNFPKQWAINAWAGADSNLQAAARAGNPGASAMSEAWFNKMVEWANNGYQPDQFPGTYSDTEGFRIPGVDTGARPSGSGRYGSTDYTGSNGMSGGTQGTSPGNSVVTLPSHGGERRIGFDFDPALVPGSGASRPDAGSDTASEESDAYSEAEAAYDQVLNERTNWKPNMATSEDYEAAKQAFMNVLSTHTELNLPEAPDSTIDYEVPDYTTQINEIRDQAFNAAKTQIENQLAQGELDIDQAIAKLPEIYEAGMNDMATQYELNKRNANEYFSANGLSSGARAQAMLAMNNVYQANMSAYRMEQAKAVQEYEDKRADLRLKAQSEITEALLQNEQARAEDLLAEYRRQDEYNFKLLLEQNEQNFKYYSLEVDKAIKQASFAEEQRQFEANAAAQIMSLEEQRRQYDNDATYKQATLSEQQRQFDAETRFKMIQLEEQRRQFDESKKLDIAKLNESIREFEAEYGLNLSKLNESIREFDATNNLNIAKFNETIREYEQEYGLNLQKLELQAQEIASNNAYREATLQQNADQFNAEQKYRYDALDFDRQQQTAKENQYAQEMEYNWAKLNEDKRQFNIRYGGSEDNGGTYPGDGNPYEPPYVPPTLGVDDKAALDTLANEIRYEINNYDPNAYADSLTPQEYAASAIGAFMSNHPNISYEVIQSYLAANIPELAG